MVQIRSPRPLLLESFEVALYVRGPSGEIELKMAVPHLADFSFYWYVLFTPVSEKSDQSCGMRVRRASS